LINIKYTYSEPTLDLTTREPRSVTMTALLTSMDWLLTADKIKQKTIHLITDISILRSF